MNHSNLESSSSEIAYLHSNAICSFNLVKGNGFIIGESIQEYVFNA